MKLTKQSRKKLEKLEIGKQFLLEVEVDLGEEDLTYDYVKLQRKPLGMVEISGFSPLPLTWMYDNGISFHDAFMEVKYAEIIISLVSEVSDNPTGNKFKLTAPQDFEFFFEIKAKSLDDVIKKLQYFFKEIHCGYKKQWDEFKKKVEIINPRLF